MLIYISTFPLDRPYIYHVRLLPYINVSLTAHIPYTSTILYSSQFLVLPNILFASQPLNISEVWWSQNSKSYIVDSCAVKFVGNENLGDRQRKAFAFIFCRQKDEILGRNVLHEEAELGRRMFFPKVNIGRVKTIPWSLNIFEVTISDVTFLRKQ